MKTTQYMDAGQQALKNIAKIALGAMGVLFVIAVVFYKERVLFADASFVVFNIVNTKSLCLGTRYGAIVTQGVPFLCQKFHLPLRDILVAYGISFNLFFLLVNAAIIYFFKQYRLAIVMALYYFLFVSESFIWISETFQGAAWMFLFFAATLYLGNKRVNAWLLLVPFSLFAFLTFFSHFAVIIPTVFLWVYFIIEKKNWPYSRNISILLSCVLVIIAGLKYMEAGATNDSVHLQGVTHFSIRDVLVTFQKPVVTVFLYRCLVNYWLGTMVFIISIGALIKNKENKLAIWTVLCALGYLIIMGLTYENLDKTTLLFHIESEWSLIGIIVATPFVFTFLPKLKPITAGGLLMVIFVIRVAYIFSFLPPFGLRNEMEEQILSRMKKKGIMKLALYNDEGLRKTAILDWALPFESILISELDGDKPERTFLFVNPDDKQTIGELNSRKEFYHTWMMLPYNNLNKAYFDIDTTKPYQIMTYAEFMK